MSDETRPESGELPEDVYDELRGIAQQLMRNQRQPDTMQATALVHEAYLRLLKSPPREEVRNRVAVLAHTMRNVLVDRARARNADRRGGGKRPITFNSELVGGRGDSELEVLAVHDALEELAKVDEELARLAELRIFGGLQEREIAAALETSLRTVERRWRLARAWLQRALGSPGE
jgi:RNA polymerase sigma factor (TIGR02999 family)